eukprot:541573_1
MSDLEQERLRQLEEERRLAAEKMRQEELEKMREEQSRKLLEEKRKLEEERRRREELERMREEQRKAAEMERMRLEAERRKQEELERMREEELKRREEEKYRMEMELIELVQKAAGKIQTATINDYKFILSNWMRLNKLNKLFQSESIMDIMLKWIESSKIFYIQNLWKGPTENRYGMYIGYKTDFTQCNQPILSQQKHFWKQIPILLPERLNKKKLESFFIQHVETEKYFCFALHGSNNIELYNEKEIKQNHAKRIICIKSNISKKDEQFVYDKNLTKTTFYLRDYQNRKHISFRGCGISFF